MKILRTSPKEQESQISLPRTQLKILIENFSKVSIPRFSPKTSREKVHKIILLSIVVILILISCFITFSFFRHYRMKYNNNGRVEMPAFISEIEHKKEEKQNENKKIV